MMRDYILNFGLCLRSSPEEEADRRQRHDAIHREAFSFGRAWGGSQPAILIRTDLCADVMMERLAPWLQLGDFLLLTPLDDPQAAHHAGMLVDEEGFARLLPHSKLHPTP
jgi:hypothetical protein